MKYESDILKRLIDTYGVVGNPHYISEIIKEFIVQGKERFPELFTYQADWLAHIDEFGLNPSYTVSYTGQSIYAPNTLERPVKSAILKGNTKEITGKNIYTGIDEDGYISLSSGFQSATGSKTTEWLPCEPNTTYVCNSPSRNRWMLKSSTGVETVVGGNTGNETPTVTTLSDTAYLRCYYKHDGYKDEITLQIEKGDISTDYEPYWKKLESVKMPVLTTSNGDGTKTNILTVNEPVELRGIGEVKDELNLLTGEVVQSVGVLNGEETGWQQEAHSQAPTDSSLIAFSIDLIKSPNKNLLSSVLVKSSNVNKPYRWYILFNSWLVITLPKSEVTNLDEFKAWLKNNEVLYPLTEKSIKTVDLTILDQNGQNVKQLMSFNGGTHFNTTSLEGSPLPVVSVSVETDLEETLKVCSLEGNTM